MLCLFKDDLFYDFYCQRFACRVGLSHSKAFVSVRLCTARAPARQLRSLRHELRCAGALFLYYWMFRLMASFGGNARFRADH